MTRVSNMLVTLAALVILSLEAAKLEAQVQGDNGSPAHGNPSSNSMDEQANEPGKVLATTKQPEKPNDESMNAPAQDPGQVASQADTVSPTEAAARQKRKNFTKQSWLESGGWYRYGITRPRW